MLGLLLMILVDAGILMLAVAAVNQGYQLDFQSAGVTAAIIFAATFFAQLFLPNDGAWWINTILAAVIAGMSIWLTLGLTLNRAFAGGAVFLALRFVIYYVLLTFLLS